MSQVEVAYGDARNDRPELETGAERVVLARKVEEEPGTEAGASIPDG